MFSQLFRYFDPNHNYFVRFILLSLVGGIAGIVFAAIYLMGFKFGFSAPGFLAGAISVAIYFTLVGIAQNNGPQFPLSTIIGLVFGGIIGPILGIALQFVTSLPDSAFVRMNLNDMLTLMAMTGVLGLIGGIAVSLSISLTRTPPYTSFTEN